MITPIKFTVEALERITLEQIGTLTFVIKGDNCEEIEVFADFSLPMSSVGVIVKYKTGTVIYGGIDAEGELST